MRRQYSVFLLLLTIGFGLTTRAQSMKNYPDPNTHYTTAQLKTFLTFYQNLKDTVGIVYTYKCWLFDYYISDYISQEEKAKMIKTLYMHRHKLRHYSEIDYYNLLLLFTSLHNGDHKSLIRHAAVCDSVIDYAEKNKNIELARTSIADKITVLIAMGASSDSIFPLLRQLKAYLDSCKENPHSLNQYHYLMGSANVLANYHERAIPYFRQVFQFCNTISPQTFMTDLSALYLAQCYRMTHQYTQAEKFAGIALQGMADRNNPELDRWTYEELALLNSLQGKYQRADGFWNRHFEIIQTLAKNKAKQLDDSGINFELLESELQQANSLKLLAEQKNTQKTIVTDSLIAVCLLLVLLLTVGVWAYRQKIRLLSQEKQIALYQGQELERAFIAKELHDNIGGTLAGIKTHLTPSIPGFDVLTKHLDDVYNSVRTLSHTLYNDDIEHVGLKQTCQDFIHLIDKEKKIVFAVYGHEVAISSFASTMIYRMIQELLTNALRHAQATTIHFNMYFEEADLLIGIEDNGKGFDPNTVSEGIGLRNIRKRILLLEAQLQINSSPEGSSFLITIPFQKKLVNTLIA